MIFMAINYVLYTVHTQVQQEKERKIDRRRQHR